MEIMKVVVNCLSFYGCQTIVYLSTFIYHCKYFVLLVKFLDVTRADLFAIYLFVA